MFRKKNSRSKDSRPDDRFSATDPVCKVHPSQAVSLFCSTCEVLVCNECVITGHNGHIYSKISDISELKSRDLAYALADIRDYYLPELKSKIGEIEDCKLQNHRAGNDKVAQIDSRFNKLVFDLKKIRDRYVAEIIDSQTHNDKRLSAAYLEVVKDVTRLEGLYGEFSTVVNTGSDVQKIKAQQMVNSALDKVHPGQLKVSLSFPIFHEGNLEHIELQNALGRLESDDELSSDFESSHLKDKVEVKIVSKIQHKQCDITAICPVSDDIVWVHGSDYTENELINTGGSVQKCIDFAFMVVDIDMAPDKCLYAGDHENAQIVKLSNDGRHQKTIDTSPLKPLGLCVARNNDILVCLVDSPSYYVDLRSRRLVARIDQSEKFIESYEYNEITRLFTKPLRVVENGNLDICVVNRISVSSGQLVVLDGEGRYKVTYKGVENTEFDPLDVKCDSAGRIIVTDGNRRIHLLDSSVNFIQYLLTEKEMVEKPWSVGVDCRKRIWIGCDAGKIYVLRCF